MNVNPIGSNMLYNTMQTANRSQQSLGTNLLKNAMDTPKQFMDLLERSIAVKSSVNLANGLGINVDTMV